MTENPSDIYCDSVEVDITDSDVVLQLHRDLSKGNSSANEFERVRISIEQAKSLASLLNDGLDVDDEFDEILRSKASVLSRMAAEALEDKKAGRTRELP